MRVLEYSGLDPDDPLDVKAGAAGSGTSRKQWCGHDDVSERLDLRSGYDRSRVYSGAGAGFSLADHNQPGRGHRGRQDGQQLQEATVRQRQTARSSWVMQMVAFRASGTSGGRFE